MRAAWLLFPLVFCSVSAMARFSASAMAASAISFRLVPVADGSTGASQPASSGWI